MPSDHQGKHTSGYFQSVLSFLRLMCQSIEVWFPLVGVGVEPGLNVPGKEARGRTIHAPGHAVPERTDSYLPKVHWNTVRHLMVHRQPAKRFLKLFDFAAASLPPAATNPEKYTRVRGSRLHDGPVALVHRIAYTTCLSLSFIAEKRPPIDLDAGHAASTDHLLGTGQFDLQQISHLTEAQLL